MKKRSWILLAGALGIVAAAAFVTRSSWMGSNASAQGPQRPRMVSVDLAKAERKSVPVDVDAIGMVTPISSVALKSRLETTIVAVHFEDGAKVNEGDLLSRWTAARSMRRSNRPRACWPRTRRS